ncbi:MAG: MFS transporter [Verrucomicrobia bacterium]|nr:MAG: MFS transporter [Verrucomicrobiota bacterium]
MSAPASSTPWWRQLTGYHWFVFIVASSAWFFDCLDQRLFSLARIPALSSLMGQPGSAPEVQAFGKVATAWFLIGWGVGGMIFGALGDRYGRAKMLTLTILIYSGFTGLTFFSVGTLDFTIYRFLTGLGVGGVFGLAVALIAETVPSGARVQSLGLLQVLSTVGNVTAGFIKLGIDSLEKSQNIAAGTGWRWMFLIGALPALLIIFTRKRLKEPEPWLRQKAEGHLAKGSILAPYVVLFRDVRWRRNIIVGALIASTGVVGLWAIAEFAPDLQKTVFQTHYEKAGFTVAQAKAKAADAISYAYLLNMAGAAAGMWIFTRMCHALGRRPAFVIGFSAALLVTAFVYWKMDSPQDAYWMMPLMGAVQLGPFAGFAIYLPELFPSRLRSTGISFCYNLGRFAAAAGSFFSSILTVKVFGGYLPPLPYRYSAIAMCSIFLIGIIAVAFAPETKGQPLPEDDEGAR